MAYKYKYGEECDEKRVETLTLNIIKKELLKNAFLQMKIWVLPFAAWAVISIGALSLTEDTSSYEKRCLYFIVLSVPVVLMLLSAIPVIKILLAARQNKIKIVADNVADLDERYFAFNLRADFSSFQRNGDYYINFKQHGKFLLPRYNYEWSNLFEGLSDKSIFERSSVGDTFYLALIGDKKIGMVYNAKLFKYEGNTDNLLH